MIIYIYITSVGNLRGTRVHLSEFRNWFAKNGFSFSFYEERKKECEKVPASPWKGIHAVEKVVCVISRLARISSHYFWKGGLISWYKNRETKTRTWFCLCFPNSRGLKDKPLTPPRSRDRQVPAAGPSWSRQYTPDLSLFFLFSFLMCFLFCFVFVFYVESSGQNRNLLR